MKIHIILSLIVLGLNAQCKNESSKKTKNEQICAVNNYNFIRNSSLKFQFFSDTSYVFTIDEKDLNHEKFEKFNDFFFEKRG